MRISDWSSDVCSSDLRAAGVGDLRDLVAGLQVDPQRHHHPYVLADGDLLPVDQIGAGTRHPRETGHDGVRLITGCQRHVPRILAGRADIALDRSEERRVGKEFVSTCSSRWSPYP